VALPTVSCEDERTCTKLSIVKDTIRSTVPEETMNCLSVLPLESDVIKLLFAETIEEYPAEEL